MSNELMKFENKALSIWTPETIPEIKKIYGAGLTDVEFQLFMEMSKAMGANPFKREIWALKYNGQPASIFTGRDFARRVMQEQADYRGHFVHAIYMNDDIDIEYVEGDGIKITKYKKNIKDPGELIGAIGYVKRDNLPPFCRFFKYKEYVQYNKEGKPNKKWSSSPAMMIEKCAEAGVARMAYNALFQGTYFEGEEWEETTTAPTAGEIAKPLIKFKHILPKLDAEIMDLVKRHGYAEAKKLEKLWTDHDGDVEAVREFLKAIVDANFTEVTKDEPKTVINTTAENFTGPNTEIEAAAGVNNTNEAMGNGDKENDNSTAGATSESGTAGPLQESDTTAGVDESAAQSEVKEDPKPKEPRKALPKWYKQRIIVEAPKEVKDLYKFLALKWEKIIEIYNTHDGDTKKIIADMEVLKTLRMAEVENAERAKEEKKNVNPAAKKADDDLPPEPDETAPMFEETKKAAEPAAASAEPWTVQRILKVIVPSVRAFFSTNYTSGPKMVDLFTRFGGDQDAILRECMDNADKYKR